MTTAVEAADRLYARWNTAGLAVLADSVDPGVELICDPLHPAESALRGLAGWQQWVARGGARKEFVQVTVEGGVAVVDEEGLAVGSISATPKGASAPLHWAAAHLWTVRAGRIAGWEPHLDLAAARRTLDA